MHGRPEELIKTDHRMHHNQANHKQAKHYEMCCDFFYDVRPSTPEDRFFYYHGLNGLDGSCPVEERLDQKVCCFPQAYALAA